jgi:hypothetical protein
MVFNLVVCAMIACAKVVLCSFRRNSPVEFFFVFLKQRRLRCNEQSWVISKDYSNWITKKFACRVERYINGDNDAAKTIIASCGRAY